MTKRLNSYFIILGLLISVASTAYANNYTFTTIDVPDATNNWGAGGINDSGTIVGTYDNATENGRVFLYSGGGFTTIDVHHAWANGINNSDSIV